MKTLPLILTVCLATTALAQTNVWTNAAGGKWETATNWSLGVGPGYYQFCFITNAGPETVTVDAVSRTSFPTNMAVTDLIVGGGNTLLLSNVQTGPPLDVEGGFSLLGGTLLITNSTFEVAGADFGCSACGFDFDGFTLASSSYILAPNIGVFNSGANLNIGVSQSSTFTLTNSIFNVYSVTVGKSAAGTLNLYNSSMTNSQLVIGNVGGTGIMTMDGGVFTSPNIGQVYDGNGGSGSLTLDNGATFSCGHLVVGAVPGPQGTLTNLVGNVIVGVLHLGQTAGASGSMLLSNGAVSCSAAYIGESGTGTVTQVSGTFTANDIYVALNPGSSGSYTIEGGTLQALNGGHNGLNVGYGAGSSGKVLLNSGTLLNTNTPISIGVGGAGSLTVAGGQVQSSGFLLGNGPGTSGALNINSGNVYSSASIVDGNNGGAGSVTVSAGGALTVTNSTGNAAISLGASSALTLDGGLMQINALILTNGGGLTNLGGTLQYSGPFQMESNTAVALSSGSLVAATNFVIGSLSNSSPVVVVGDAASLTVTNGPLSLGNDGTNAAGSGSLIVSNGAVSATVIDAGGSTNSGPNVLAVSGTNAIFRIGDTFAGASHYSSSITVHVTNNSRLTVGASMSLGAGAFASGSVEVRDGGFIIVTNALGLGNDGTANNGSGTGSMTISNGTARFGSAVLGSSLGGRGVLQLQSNALMVLQTGLIVGAGTNSSGSVNLDGGLMVATNVPEVQVGANGGCGSLTLNSGTMIAQSVHAGVGVGSSGTVLISGGIMNIIHNGGCNACGLAYNSCGATGMLQVVSGAISAPDSPMNLGTANVASMTMSGGSVELGSLIAGGGAASVGTISMSGGQLKVNGDISLAPSNSTTTASASITGGTLTATNGTVSVGSMGQGFLTVGTGGSVQASQIKLGGTTPGASGFLHLTTGGTVTIRPQNQCGACGFTTNDGEQDGGLLDVAPASLVIGEGHNARYHISGGTALATSMFVGYTPGFTGTYLHEGGTVMISSNVVVGDCASGALGQPTLRGGSLYVTNAGQTAVLEVRNGTFTMTGGALVADVITLTNGCGHFSWTGGTISYNTLVLPTNAPPLALTIARGASGTNAVISWPSPYIGYTLQQTANLAASSWGPVSAPMSDDETNRSATVGISSGAAFYRLSR
ncbi:MAG: hypothetical protein C5B50_11710 [Verrucomicrobia bacterium]|nr:MAG: hypothetical protein C5B50_11710 [Verrucomicrobiota bacterium]